MDFTNIILLLSGVALFLFGMSVMGDSLKKVAGSKMETVLYKLSSNTFKGVLLGTGVTAVIQSSSATSVMVVGFVNSGSSLSGEIAPDMVLIPNIKTAKPKRIPPTFFAEVFFANIHKMIPATATMPVRTSVLK
ncbi:MAG: Na/Pi symporter [Parasporobacterium sp.]|nr:Na/Pi symporter [Parasporobacterium sp.]